jgi:hypothetical protein
VAVVIDTLRRFWHTFANALVSFLEEAAFRIELVWAVILGRVPIERERRLWNRSVESPILVDAYDFTDSRLLFSLLVWPSLESPAHRARRDQEARLREIKESFGNVCTDRAWSVLFQTQYLEWDSDREAWVSDDGHAYDGARLRDFARSGGTVRVRG